MVLEEVLVKKKDTILKRWFDLIAQTHPDGGASLVKNKDRFANPVGHITSSTIATLYEEFLQGKQNSERVTIALYDILKIRAVQDFSPSKAIAFVFLLKNAIRAELEDEIYKTNYFEELTRIESRIDELASHAFDIYMDCREMIYKVRVDEMKITVDNITRLLERQSNKGVIV